MPDSAWSEDSGTLYVTSTNRAYKDMWLTAVDASTGSHEVLAHETGKTYVEMAHGSRLDPASWYVFGDGDVLETPFERWHTLFVRAVDNEGTPDPTPDYRSFNATNFAPTVSLREPVRAGQIFTGPPVVVFNWDGADPQGDYTNIDPVSQDGFESGWARIDMYAFPVANNGVVFDDIDLRDPLGYDTGYDGTTQFGLPVTGFWAFEAQNGFIDDGAGGTALANYGGLFNHRATFCFAGPDCRDDFLGND